MISRQAIKKYILVTYKLPDNAITAHYFRLAIDKGFREDIFTFPNGIYKTFFYITLLMIYSNYYLQMK
jgi:hypothetical protein